jgi:hypothetical protein
VQVTGDVKMQFQTGKTYSTRSVCNSDCVFTVTIKKRTDKTVTCVVRGEEKTFRLSKDHYGSECFMPFGRYSMAPIITARS